MNSLVLDSHPRTVLNGARKGHSPPRPLGRGPPKGPLPQHTVELHFGADVQRVRVSLLQGRRGRHRVGLGHEHPATEGLPPAWPTHPRAGEGGGLPARAGARQAAAGAVGARPRRRRRGAAGSGAAALKRAGAERGADGARGAQPAAGARDWGGPGGNSARAPASSFCTPLPATAPILVAPIGWAGQVS